MPFSYSNTIATLSGPAITKIFEHSDYSYSVDITELLCQDFVYFPRIHLDKIHEYWAIYCWYFRQQHKISTVIIDCNFKVHLLLRQSSPDKKEKLGLLVLHQNSMTSATYVKL